MTFDEAKEQLARRKECDQLRARIEELEARGATNEAYIARQDVSNSRYAECVSRDAERISELEARINRAADQISRLELERWEFAKACAAKDAALKPLARVEIYSDQHDGCDPTKDFPRDITARCPLTAANVLAARAALAIQIAPPAPGTIGVTTP